MSTKQKTVVSSEKWEISCNALPPNGMTVDKVHKVLCDCLETKLSEILDFSKWISRKRIFFFENFPAAQTICFTYASGIRPTDVV